MKNLSFIIVISLIIVGFAIGNNYLANENDKKFLNSCNLVGGKAYFESMPQKRACIDNNTGTLIKIKEI